MHGAKPALLLGLLLFHKLDSNQVHFLLRENCTGSTFGGVKTGPDPLLVHITSLLSDKNGCDASVSFLSVSNNHQEVL